MNNNGRKTNFRNIVIMTINAGPEVMQKSTIGFTNACELGDEMADIQKFFMPAPQPLRYECFIQDPGLNHHHACGR